MGSNTSISQSIALTKWGIKNSKINYQLTPEILQEKSVEDYGGKETANGTLAVHTGEFTGRSPMDRFIVKDEVTEDKVWWGNINLPFESDKFDALLNKVTAYLDGKELFVRDAYACAHEDYRLKL
jgi:phosphoenolpyruvate carboxykinase (ATP)